MNKYRHIKQRVFVRDRKTGEPRLVSLCPEIACGPDGVVSFPHVAIGRDTLPLEFDTIFPQDVFLVYQDGPDRAEFFNPAKPGTMYTLQGFRAVFKGQPIVFLQRIDTGEVSQAPPEIEFYCTRIKREIGDRCLGG